MKAWQKKLLKDFSPCPDALEWACQFETAQEAWDACERGDWMLWYLGKLCGKPRSKSHKKLVPTACQCARTAWKRMTKEGKKAIQKKCADIVRKHYPRAPK